MINQATVTDLRYQGDAVVQESVSVSGGASAVSRTYALDDAGRIVEVCDPDCGSGTVYVVAWSGHGDATGLWRRNGDGSLTLANSYTYSTWGTPATTVAAGFSDLRFRYLYVGASDVQWDNSFGLGLYYMHARSYSPSLGRFLLPDPARADGNLYAYAGDSPVTKSDPSGLWSCPNGFPCKVRSYRFVWTWAKAFAVGAASAAGCAAAGAAAGGLATLSGLTLGPVALAVIGAGCGGLGSVLTGITIPNIGSSTVYTVWVNQYRAYVVASTYYPNGVLVSKTWQYFIPRGVSDTVGCADALASSLGWGGIGDVKRACRLEATVQTYPSHSVVLGR